MDPNIQNDIKLQAKEVYSEDFIKLRDELQSLKALLNMDSNNLNLRKQHAVKYKEYQSARIQQSIKKRDVINKIMTKYPLLQHSDIMPYIDEAILGPPEDIALTIPAVYPKPTRSDMAVLLVYFNACSYKNLQRNLKLTYQSLIDAEIPVFLVEHLFKDQEPIFPENGTTIFNTRSDSYMFYKENLLNWLMPRIPSQFTKLYMMDCDLIFSSPTWYDDVSALLDTHDVVQPFQEAIWLNSDLKTVYNKIMGCAYEHSKGINYDLSWQHPGFAWAFRRDFIEPIGIFDIGIIGNGDTIIASSSLRADSWRLLSWKNDILWLIKYHDIYYDKYKNVRTTYFNQILYHLWHGSKLNRNYGSRYKTFGNLCLSNNISTTDNLLKINSYGLYEYKEDLREPFNQIILEYFKSRNEDEDPIIATPPISNIINTGDNIILYIENTCDYHYEIIAFVLEKYETIIKTNIDIYGKGIEIFLNCGPSESFKEFVKNTYPNVKLEVPKYCNYYINCTIYKNNEQYISLNKNAYYIAHEVFPTENKNIIFLTPLNNTNYILCDRLPYCDNVKPAELPIFVIQGDIKRRDLDILKIILEGSYDYDYRIKILGRTRLPSEFDKYSDKLILKYDLNFIDYHSEFLDCYCILPLITKDKKPEYYSKKLTSSIIYGLTYNLHFLIDKDLQDIYNLKNASVFENKGEITECFKSVLATFTSGAKYRS